MLRSVRQIFSLGSCFRFCLILALAAGCAHFSRAAESRYRFDSWTTENGLPQVSVNSICQTRDGFLWMTTFGGLVRYDGLRFQTFTTGNTKGLRTGRFIQLKEDGEGNLWIGTEGQGVTRYRDGVFTTFTTDNGLPDNEVLLLDLDPSGALILETEHHILRWDGEKFVAYPPPPNEPDIRPMLRTRSGTWYFQNAHLQKYKDGNLIVDLPTELDIPRLFEDSTETVWIAAAEKDLLYTLKDGKLSGHTAAEGFPQIRLGTVMESSSGQIWFGAAEGLFLFDGQKFTRFTTDDGLVRGAVNALYQDREGTLWVGTTGGLSRLTHRAITAYSAKDGLAGDNVYPVYEDHTGKIWIGSWAGLTVYENGVFTSVEAHKSELFTSMLEDRHGNMWFGTFSGVIAPPGLQIQLPASLRPANVRAIYEDSAGNIWFGSITGLVKFDGKDFTTFTQKDGFLAKGVFAIRQDRSGTMWFGTEAGLVTFRDGQFTSITEKYGIAGNIVRTIHEDKDGTLWIGMYDSGIYRFKDGGFTHYTTEQGLFDNGAFQIVEDESGNFWISCNLGIYRVRKAELDDLAEGRIKEVTSIVYNKRDGMLNSECNGGGQNAGLRAKDGRIWFPTQQGVAVLDPRTIPFNAAPPPVVIESLVIDTKAVDQYHEVKLQPDQSSLEVHYSGLSFISPELVKFKYKLEGLDPDWVDAGTRRTAYYSHIPPGSYTFKVLASNRDGVWNEQGAAIAVTVLPPYWRTWWFLVLASVIVALMILTLYRRRINLLKKTNAAREAFARQLIDSQESERKRIAAELHDSLGQSLVLIKNWALLGLGGLNGKDPSKSNFEEISATASEAIKEVREIAYNLGPYQLERLGLRNTIKEMVQKVADVSPMEFNTDIGEIDGCLEREAEIGFFRIVQEAINNVVKHSGSTEAHLKIRTSQELLIFMMWDNGKGFDPERTKNGFGLLGMNERVGLLRGELLVRSEIGKGTSIKVILPCKKL
jgi:signal transduction histidine kinase/ligand-binding sensor domain-containing protein